VKTTVTDSERRKALVFIAKLFRGEAILLGDFVPMVIATQATTKK
jgi:hypothetical protein